MLCEDFIEFCDLAMWVYPRACSRKNIGFKVSLRGFHFAAHVTSNWLVFPHHFKVRAKGWGAHSFKISSGADVVVWASCLGLFAGYPLPVWF